MNEVSANLIVFFQRPGQPTLRILVHPDCVDAALQAMTQPENGKLLTSQFEDSPMFFSEGDEFKNPWDV